MIEQADVVVIGLGPAGASAAAEAARRGCKVIALDRRAEPGLPVQCAELVPAMLPVDAATVRQAIDSMLTFVEEEAPDATPHFPGRMLDRAAFDASLVAEAGRAGADCRFSAFVKSITPDGKILTKEGRTLEAKIIIGADGPRSVAGRAIGSVNRELVETRQVTVPLLERHAATDIFLSAGIPGGYGWLFPKGDRANLGAGVSPEHKGRLKKIVEDLHEKLFMERRIGKATLALTGGAIPVGGMVKPHGMIGDVRVLLAGDAAGLANPVTGAGIAAAVQSGRLAGEFACHEEPSSSSFHEEMEDMFAASLERALLRRRELLRSRPEKSALRRGWIAYPEYWT